MHESNAISFIQRYKKSLYKYYIYAKARTPYENIFHKHTHTAPKTWADKEAVQLKADTLYSTILLSWENPD